MTLVVDASVVFAALVDRGPVGRWADSMLHDEGLVAPHLMPAEVTSGLRRAAAAGTISVDAGGWAQAELMRLPVAYYPFDPVADRVWELRENVTAYDGWYVALAESLGVPMATLDNRLASAAGPRCRFRVYGGVGHGP